MKFSELSISENVNILPYYNKKISIVNKEEAPVRFQIPRMFIPFGVSGFVTGSGPTKWHVDFSVKDQDLFYDFVKNFEEYVIREVEKQSEEIFKVQKTFEELQPMFNSNMKDDPQGVWESKFRVKIDNDCAIFNQHDERIDPEFEDKMFNKYSGIGIVEPHSVYFMQGKFGITWKMYQLKIYEPQMLKGFAFRNV